MSSLTATIALFASHNPLMAYVIIYLATIFAGNISAFVSFWIITQSNFGAWGLPLLILTIFAADFSGDLLWYTLGRKLRGTKFGEWVKKHLPGHERAETTLQNHGHYWIYFSKFVIGSAPPVIFSIGWTGMPLKKFIKNSLISILLWLPILIGLAYGLISGLSPLNAIDGFRKFEWNFLIGIALFVFLNYIVAHSFTKILKKLDKKG